ncbi:MAG: EAL domain-containing protein [Oscillatoriophycideae cyanobacterium NC_groundwater_1537_Pr4_S-0.65um_50_18]|nr:EAL domain-containing protein [Oscillatoriophycideae cyanobacterium NC_groundwater_1537_Pr4_S-0.65um_50_18]
MYVSPKGHHTRKVSLHLILVIPFALQIFAAVGLTGWVSLRNGQKAVNELADRLRLESGDRIASHLDCYLAVPQQINQANADAIELGLLDLRDLRTTGRFFWKQMQIFDVGYINFASPQEEFIGVERLDNGNLLINETTRSNTAIMSVYETDGQGNRSRLQSTEMVNEPVQLEAWYAEAAKARHPVWSKIYQWDDKPILSISSSYPIYEGTRLVGVIGVDLILSQIGTFLHDFKLSPASQTFILERDGLLVASSDLEKPFKLVKGEAQRLKATESSQPLVQATSQYLNQHLSLLNRDLSQITTRQQFQFDLNGTRQFVQVTPWSDRSGLDWLIVVVVPESDFMEVINANTRTTILLCLASLAIATLIGMMTSRLLVKQILHMIEAAEALSQGNWQQMVSEPQSHELALLAKAFNRMAGHLQTSFTQLEHNAHHDALTGLLNPTAFKVRLEEAIARYDYQAVTGNAQLASDQPLYQPPYQQGQQTGRQAGYPTGSLMGSKGSSKGGSDIAESCQFAVLFLDLDYFKLVNDSLGHLAGDQLLIAVTKRLINCTRTYDLLARFGGDEFMILLNPITTSADAAQVAERILQELQYPFTVDGNEVFISTSIGIALSNSGAENPEAYLRNADIAMYHAKAKGKAGYEIFNAQMHTEAVKRLQLETDLRWALERQELEVYYQPILDVPTQKIAGFEALLRWHHPTLGMVSPVEFIPIAEDTGLIITLGWWALRQACQQMKIWQQQYESCQTMVINVNLSCKQFLQSDLLEQIDCILSETDLQPQYLKLEITESLFMSHTEATRFKLRRLRNHGVNLSIDDFGTGYSSLSYLQRFPINTLKIDRSFITHLGTGGENSAIVEAIMVLAHKLGISVVAEGVETVEQLDYLQAIGCEQAQGYLFSCPVAAHKIAELLSSESVHSSIQARSLHRLSSEHCDRR